MTTLLSIKLSFICVFYFCKLDPIFHTKNEMQHVILMFLFEHPL
jgi:hypothetical protein